MVSQNPQFVHESEAQRQYIRLRLPSMVDIDGASYTVRDLSTGGLGIRGIEKPPKKGERLHLTLQLPFERFSLDISLTAEVQYHDKALQLTGCRFVDLDAAQVSILNHIVRAYIGGDIVDGSDILHVVARNGFVTMRRPDAPPERTLAARMRDYSLYGILTLTAAALAWFLLSSAAQQIFTLSTPHGVIAGDTMTIAAPASGVFETTFPESHRAVARGAVIGTIKSALSPTGTDVSITSPCDCFIAARAITAGQYAAEGTTLFTLVPQTGTTRVEAMIPQEQAHKIRMGRDVRIAIAGGGDAIAGTITDIRAGGGFLPGAPGAAPSPAATLTITTERPVKADLIGRPVFVTIRL